jgi:hypothetical protein
VSACGRQRQPAAVLNEEPLADCMSMTSAAADVSRDAKLRDHQHPWCMPLLATQAHAVPDAPGVPSAWPCLCSESKTPLCHQQGPAAHTQYGTCWLLMADHVLALNNWGYHKLLNDKKRQWTKSVSLSLFFLPATTGSALCASLLFAAVPNRQCQVQDAVQLPHCHYQPVLCVVLLHRVDRTSYVP